METIVSRCMIIVHLALEYTDGVGSWRIVICVPLLGIVSEIHSTCALAESAICWFVHWSLDPFCVNGIFSLCCFHFVAFLSTFPGWISWCVCPESKVDPLLEFLSLMAFDLVYERKILFVRTILLKLSLVSHCVLILSKSLKFQDC